MSGDAAGTGPARRCKPVLPVQLPPSKGTRGCLHTRSLSKGRTAGAEGHCRWYRWYNHVMPRSNAPKHYLRIAIAVMCVPLLLVMRHERACSGILPSPAVLRLYSYSLLVIRAHASVLKPPGGRHVGMTKRVVSGPWPQNARHESGRPLPTEREFCYPGYLARDSPVSAKFKL